MVRKHCGGLSHSMPKICVIDTYYSQFLSTLELEVRPYNYAAVLESAMRREFGTSDVYSKHLRSFGWETQDVIANWNYLQCLWAAEHGMPTALYPEVLAAQIESFKPDVLFLQDLNVLGDKLEHYSSRYFMAAQCSCSISHRRYAPYFDLIFTSFPHYVRRFTDAGIRGKCIYNPLGFEPSLLDRVKLGGPRDIDVSFVGGVGSPWPTGTRFLEAFARALPPHVNFHWYGYGQETLRPNSPLLPFYRGPAWGLDMYKVYSRSKIVLNRHSDASMPYANNLRMFEATGMGAMLLTESAPNLREHFNPGEECRMYSRRNVQDAVNVITHLLANPAVMDEVAYSGHKRTLRDHTWRDHVRTVSDSIMEMMK